MERAKGRCLIDLSLTLYQELFTDEFPYIFHILEAWYIYKFFAYT